MKELTIRYGALCKERGYLYSLFVGFFVLTISFVLANYAGEYSSRVADQSVTDLILDNIELRDVTFIHVHAALMFWIVFSIYIMTKPGTLPFITKTAAVFILVRSAFICLTHLGTPMNHLTIPTNFSSIFVFTGDFFFSGHVGGPFLLMLVFWKHIKLRYFYLSVSIFFAFIVLVGHLHYSIDVFAAPFITYCIYQFSRFVFMKDYQFFEQEME